MKWLEKYIVLVFILLCSCSSEDAKIKESLKGSIPIDVVNGYKLKEYSILETILDINIKDSITECWSRMSVNESLIQSDSARLKPILANMNDCKVQRANTFYYLRSTYDRLIRDYEEMHDDIILKIKEKEEENRNIKDKLKKLENVLETAISPIIYYKIKHVYDLDGMRKEEIVTLDFDYNFIYSEQ